MKSYQIAYKKEYAEILRLSGGEALCDTLHGTIDPSLRYKLRVRGEVAIPDNHRTESVYPLYFRKIDESLKEIDGEYALSLDGSNLEYERSAYQMIRGVPRGRLDFSVKYRREGKLGEIRASIEVYYGQPNTRYYYETADELLSLELTENCDFTTLSGEIELSRDVDFIMLKISAKDFTGEAEIFAPVLSVGGKNYALPYEYAPERIKSGAWIGEGFSKMNQPSFTLTVNGHKVFEGRRHDRLHHFAGVEFEIPDGILRDTGNEITLEYGEKSRHAYSIKEIQLITLPKETELIATSPYQVTGVPFGVLCYFKTDCDTEIRCDTGIEYLGEKRQRCGMQVLRFVANECGRNKHIELNDGMGWHGITVKCISEKRDDEIITGSGDFIYINQNESDFFEYLAWYLNEGIGDMFTLRSCYRWGASAEADPAFWEKAIDCLRKLGLYYVLMVDGRELNGVNANPSPELLRGDHFLGEQTHERDGAFTYWAQDADEYEAFFYHLLSRKLERSGIYGKYSPVYDKKGRARIYYADDNIGNVRDAYEELLRNLKRTAAEGTTRHTGVTPLFDIFLRAGYKWVGYESMYGSHEIILGALRGMSGSAGHKRFGTHLALQWSTVPSDDPSHAVRYRLSLYLSYMHGVTDINTEEGLWTIETPFADNDRYSAVCTRHREEQRKFNAFVKTHTRPEKQIRQIAMIVGRYDGMDCFSTGRVYGQAGEEWKYSSPEDSWDLIKTFYPEAKIGALYYFVKEDGKESLKPNERDYLDMTSYDRVRRHESLGYFSSTPYGAIDIISDRADNLSDYKAIFFTGWNSCSEEQLMRLYAFMENGGTLLLTRAHLYDTYSRADVFSGNAEIISSPYLEKLLSHKNIRFIDKAAYPAEIAEEYSRELRTIGECFGGKFIRDAKNVSYTEYLGEDGSVTLYLLDINWWESCGADCKLVLCDCEYPLKLFGNELHTVYISPDRCRAVMMRGGECDLKWRGNDYELIGDSTAKYTLIENGKLKTINS